MKNGKRCQKYSSFCISGIFIFSVCFSPARSRPALAFCAAGSKSLSLLLKSLDFDLFFYDTLFFRCVDDFNPVKLRTKIFLERIDIGSSQHLLLLALFCRQSDRLLLMRKLIDPADLFLCYQVFHLFLA